MLHDKCFGAEPSGSLVRDEKQYGGTRSVADKQMEKKRHGGASEHHLLYHYGVNLLDVGGKMQPSGKQDSFALCCAEIRVVSVPFLEILLYLYLAFGAVGKLQRQERINATVVLKVRVGRMAWSA